MNFHRSTFLIALIGLSLMAQHTWAKDLESRLYFGIWSEHWYADRPGFNEDNEVVQYTLHNKMDSGSEFISAATFLNSYGLRTWAAGYGQEYNVFFLPELQAGWEAGIMYGYGDRLRVNWNGITPSIKFHFKYEAFKLQIMGPAVNVGLETSF